MSGVPFRIAKVQHDPDGEDHVESEFVDLDCAARALDSAKSGEGGGLGLMDLRLGPPMVIRVDCVLWLRWD